jgi:hypothetical protein
MPFVGYFAIMPTAQASVSRTRLVYHNSFALLSTFPAPNNSPQLTYAQSRATIVNLNYPGPTADHDLPVCNRQRSQFEGIQLTQRSDCLSSRFDFKSGFTIFSNLFSSLTELQQPYPVPLQTRVVHRRQTTTSLLGMQPEKSRDEA